jgi:uncharacterized protein with HEPN domain
MQRELKVYINDILDGIRKIEQYTNKLSFEEFLENELVQDGVVRNLEIIGETVKKIPEDVRKKKSEIEWKKVAGLRDILIHEYFVIDFELVWDVVKNKVPELKLVALSLAEEINHTCG